MTEHPAKGCTKKQREAFELVAIGQDGFLHPRTMQALFEKGLVERIIVKQGIYSTFRYQVPLVIHAQWCQWCGENEVNAA